MMDSNNSCTDCRYDRMLPTPREVANCEAIRVRERYQHLANFRSIHWHAQHVQIIRFCTRERTLWDCTADINKASSNRVPLTVPTGDLEDAGPMFPT